MRNASITIHGKSIFSALDADGNTVEISSVTLVGEPAVNLVSDWLGAKPLVKTIPADYAILSCRDSRGVYIQETVPINPNLGINGDVGLR